MNQVPEMISTKDLAYLEDMMHWNFTDCKVANHFKQEVQDEEIQKMIEQVAMMHKKHYQELLNMLTIGG